MVSIYNAELFDIPLVLISIELSNLLLFSASPPKIEREYRGRYCIHLKVILLRFTARSSPSSEAQSLLAAPIDTR